MEYHKPHTQRFTMNKETVFIDNELAGVQNKNLKKG